MKKLLSIILVAIILIAGLFYFFKPEADIASKTDTGHQSSEQLLSNHSNYPRKNNLGVSEDILKKAQAETQILNAVTPDQIDQRTIPDYFTNIEQGVLFQYDPLVIETKNVGDHIQFKLLKYGINRQATITNIEQVDEDIMRWKGVFDDLAADLNHFSITQSQKDNYSIMKVFTDKGNYVAEIKNGVGLATSINDELHDDEIHDHEHDHHH